MSMFSDKVEVLSWPEARSVRPKIDWQARTFLFQPILAREPKQESHCAARVTRRAAGRRNLSIAEVPVFFFLDDCIFRPHQAGAC